MSPSPQDPASENRPGTLGTSPHSTAVREYVPGRRSFWLVAGSGKGGVRQGTQGQDRPRALDPSMGAHGSSHRPPRGRSTGK